MLSGRANIKKALKADICWAVLEEEQDRLPLEVRADRVPLAAEKQGVWEERRSEGKRAARTWKALSTSVRTFFYFEWDGETLKGSGKRGVRN